MSGEDWTTANQRVLRSEFARLHAQLANSDPSEAIREATAARHALQGPAAMDVLAKTFDLTSFELDVVLLCAHAELQLMPQSCGQPQSCIPDDITFGYAMAHLANAHWSALAPFRPLRQWQLVELLDSRSPAHSRVSLDERVLHFIAGANYLDGKLRSVARASTTTNFLSASQSAAIDPAIRSLITNSRTTSIVQLQGTDLAAHREVAWSIAAQFGLELHEMDALEIPQATPALDELALLWTRDALLLPSALLVRVTESLPPAAAAFLARAGGLTFVSTPRPISLDREHLAFKVERPLVAEQKDLWREALGADAGRFNGSLTNVSSIFRLDTETILRSARMARRNLPVDGHHDLVQLCRDATAARLDDVAHQVDPVATWSDLVLPQPQLETLRQIAAHVRQRHMVYDKWGFGSRGGGGLGIAVLFTGESGTGKTMAAEVLANELKLDVYRIDLSSLVSKYIGETEKNLRRVFDAADESGAILLFDEADALFGKRSEVKDSHDRYANIEVSYLLQRMEAYRGLAILTTNFKAALDQAFLRRLKFIVQFPFPDHELREQIWRGAFPANTPISNINHKKLAQLNVSGGSIRNIALNAAVLAAESTMAIDMSHLLSAARTEAAKRERPFTEAETKGWS